VVKEKYKMATFVKRGISKWQLLYSVKTKMVDFVQRQNTSI